MAFKLSEKKQDEPFVAFDDIEVDLNRLENCSVDLETYKTARANGRGFELLYQKLDDEALVNAVENCLKHCRPSDRGTYDYILQKVLVPELIKRLNNK